MVEIPNRDKAAILLYSMAPETAATVLQLLGEKHAVQLRELMRYYAELPDIDELVEQVLAEFEELGEGEVDLSLGLLGIGGSGGARSYVDGGVDRPQTQRPYVNVRDKLAAYQFAFSETSADNMAPILDDLEDGPSARF